MRLYNVLSSSLSLSKQEISAYLLSAPKKYRVYSIPKRTTGKRTIAHPAKQLKNYQRAITKALIPILPVHSRAFAYKDGQSIRDNAAQHMHSKFLLKMDFQNFFHSITPELFFMILARVVPSVSREDHFILRQVLFWNPSKKDGGKLILSIGAPSSPLISNFVMYFFDEALEKLCKEQSVVYSRYADDLTFSSNKKGVLFEIPKRVKLLLKEQFDGRISINESKTVFSSKAHNRHVTGVTITNEGKLSIGRERKRYISALIHRYKIGDCSEEDIPYIQGMLAYAFDIEPMFEKRMVEKYSCEVIKRIKQGV